MCQSNRSFNIPPPGNPPGKFLFKFPPPPAKKLFKCPTIRSISSDQISPSLGKLVNYLIIQNKESQVSLAHGWKKVSWDAFSCWPKSSKCSASNIMKSLRKNSGIFHIKHCRWTHFYSWAAAKICDFIIGFTAFCHAIHSFHYLYTYISIVTNVLKYSIRRRRYCTELLFTL